MRVGVTGVTGFVGKALARALAGRGDVVVGFTRRPERLAPGCAEMRGAPEGGGPLDVAGLDAVVNLAGEPVYGRWTAARKRRMLDSRVGLTERVVAGLAALPEGGRPRALVSASGTGIYGVTPGDEVATEGCGWRGADFLGALAGRWEAAAEAAGGLGVRVTCLRIGMVLGRGGGALGTMVPAFRLCLGARLGNGRQWMPWIHLDDLVGLILLALEDGRVRGPVNAVAPEGVRNGEFTQALGRALGRPAVFVAPAWGLRLALGEFAEVMLGSQRVGPEAALRAGYGFKFPTLDAALGDLVGR